jgi:spermidine dehydrogenase
MEHAPPGRVLARRPLPIEVSRQGYGRVSIANSDAGAYTYVHSAIDQAAHAVAELLGDVGYPAWAGFTGPPLDAVGL